MKKARFWRSLACASLLTVSVHGTVAARALPLLCGAYKADNIPAKVRVTGERNDTETFFRISTCVDRTDCVRFAEIQSDLVLGFGILQNGAFAVKFKGEFGDNTLGLIHLWKDPYGRLRSSMKFVIADFEFRTFDTADIEACREVRAIETLPTKGN